MRPIIKKISVSPHVDQSKDEAADRLNSRRFYRRLRRQALKAGITFAEARHGRVLLDALRGGHPSQFKKKNKRKTKTANRIRLKNFSFVDNPKDTLERLRDIAIADAQGQPYYVDFLDSTCFDIAPYLTFGLIRREMQTSLCKGGKIQDELCDVISSLGMNRFLNMRYSLKPGANAIQPFPMIQQSRRLSTANDHHLEKTRKEAAAGRFAESLDSWLHNIGYELNDAGLDNVRAFVGEILDNTRHAILSVNGEGDSDWCIAGFLARRKRADGSVQLACHLALISLGRCVAETLDNASKTLPDLKRRIDDYCNKHTGYNRAYDRDALITAMSLTDRITCQPPESTVKAGCGMSTFIGLINFLGAGQRLDELPAFTIVSGTSCVRVNHPFNNMVEHKDQDGNITRFQCFNPQQNGSLPPSGDHVYKLPFKFPGTVIAARFFLDRQTLDQRYEAVNTEPPKSNGTSSS